ncbi:uncharacterized protein A1O9_05514 [Exophiala aquamarina CBS 119918]|uniref:U3 small nucleolar RNA-associated protein 14 n=1 Tax=Exophiala aquamarina CBS 119918 TaxID=1182545 RepID=A0A072PCK7_9EURO|nr:uncharacterized protein A1O9_05514 [Exophiala aquamarina CBS 119918]KEF57596.1 hypothetical protein A1O9_05514 [Exophiala aquamarina CBS 119918]
MPRKAHGRSLYTSKPAKPLKRKTTNRRLNALEIAEEENLDRVKVPQHRLGEVDVDSEEPRTGAGFDGRSSKRRKINTTHQADSADEGSDLDGSRWHVGVDDEDEDSDIDSDGAFGQSDEEKFSDFTFRGSTSTVAKPKNALVARKADLNEDAQGDDQSSDVQDDESDGDLGDEAVDLATAWDMDDQQEAEAGKTQKRKHNNGRDQGFESNEDDSEEEISEDDQSDQLSVSEDEGDHSRLQNFVEGLTAKSAEPAGRSRHTTKSLPDKPSQYGLSASKLSAADLLQYIKDPRQRQSLKALQNNDVKGHETYKSGIPGKVAPPLAKRQQDRLDRSAAYDESKKELSKWIETVKENRRAEHLSFPLEDPAAAGVLNKMQLSATSQSKPMNFLESSIQAIMLESGLSSKPGATVEDQVQAYEELEEKKMPLEEVQARRAELRRTRDLMFREEIRARRVKKIKSKAYRRVHRREREKMNFEERAQLDAEGLINSDEERDRNDRRRAEERMGARHRESKWAKSLKATGRAAWDSEARHGVNDLAKRDEELRRRIDGKAGNESDGDESDSLESAEYSNTDDERENLQAKLNALEADESYNTHSRLSSMAFMQKAEAARKAANNEEIRKAKRDLRFDDSKTFTEFDIEDEFPAGRQKFGSKTKMDELMPQKVVQKSEFEERASDEELAQSDGQERDVVPAPKPSSTAHAAPKMDKILSSKTASRAKQSLEREASSSGKFKPATVQRSALVQQKTKGTLEARLDDYTSSSASEAEDDKAALAQDIFAGPDELVQEFEKEKNEIVAEEGDQIVDNTLPGWGSWAGEGISKKAQKRAKGKVLATIQGVAKDKRRDAKLERVIINEKRVKKNDKYRASELPHPFESRQQYERSLRLPLGPEWTTKSTFQDATKPRVLMKQGVIRPMARPLV